MFKAIAIYPTKQVTFKVSAANIAEAHTKARRVAPSALLVTVK
jgi:hypothetical protein